MITQGVESDREDGQKNMESSGRLVQGQASPSNIGLRDQKDGLDS